MATIIVILGPIEPPLIKVIPFPAISNCEATDALVHSDEKLQLAPTFTIRVAYEYFRSALAAAPIRRSTNLYLDTAPP